MGDGRKLKTDDVVTVAAVRAVFEKERLLCFLIL